MALIECTECGSRISDEATSCPKCGKPQTFSQNKINIKPEYRALGYIILGLAVISIFAVLAIRYFNNREVSTDLANLNPLKTYDIFLESRENTLKATQRVLYSFTPIRRGYAKAKVVETFGRNIEFEIRKDGKQIFASGVLAGKAEGVFEVSSGKYNFIVINDNIFETKSIETSLRVDY